MKRFIPSILIPLVLFVFTLFNCCTVGTVSPRSPDGKVRVTLESGNNGLCYSVWFHGELLVRPSRIRLEFLDQPPFGDSLEVELISETSVDETWKLLWGKTEMARNHYNEYLYRVSERGAGGRFLEMHFRLFDDGVAFRYSFPALSGFGSFSLSEELTGFHIDPGNRVWATNHGHYYTSQEHPYNERSAGEIEPDELIGCPVLVDAGKAGWLLLTEADLTDWAGLYFRSGRQGEGTLVSSLASLKRDSRTKVEGEVPAISPWRVIMLGNDPGDLIESDMIANLNDPCAYEDVSWIRPGISAWDRWWSGDYGPDAEFELGMNTATMCYFIDLADEMDWEYMIVDWTWYGTVFLEGDGWVPDPDVDITRPIKEVDIEGIIQYAAERDVRIILWVHSDHLERQMEEAMEQYEKWGAAGIKVDFMDCDDQDMVNWYHKVTRKAAEHHLVVDFHGAYKPTGVSRTLPNMLTREGVLGNEYTKWSDLITPRHTVILPFTRGVLGEMDFTPGGFNHIHQDDFVIVGPDAPNPYVMGTRCHQLAMTVVYESAFMVICDSPYNYRGEPGSDFLKLVPATWSETRYLGGYPGAYIALARRSGDRWFIGGMTNEESREFDLLLDFVKDGQYHATIWRDADDAAENPAHLEKVVKRMERGEAIQLRMERGGGFVMVLEPAI